MAISPISLLIDAVGLFFILFQQVAAPFHVADPNASTKMLHFSLPIEEHWSHRPRDRSNQQVDRAKGKTLDEISAIVQKINQQLKEKKNKLAPQIKARLVTFAVFFHLFWSFLMPGWPGWWRRILQSWAWSQNSEPFWRWVCHVFPAASGMKWP